MKLTNLDMDVLRTLAVATDLGGFGRAAERLGRSQSAISLQMRKLEEQVGQGLFRKRGRGIELTEAGDLVLSYARRILALNDEAMSAARGVAIDGSVRFGLPPDLAGPELKSILGQFRAAHPGAHVETKIDRNFALNEQLAQGELDLIVTFRPIEKSAAVFTTELPLMWIGRSDLDLAPGQELPLALLNPPCLFRQAAIEALEEARQPWRITFTSPSLSGIWAATEAGLGLTVRTALGVPDTLRSPHPRPELPSLPTIGLALYRTTGALSAAGERLQSILVELLGETGQSCSASSLSAENSRFPSGSRIS